jgi:hypothetical protein
MEKHVWLAGLILAFALGSVEIADAKPKGQNSCDAKYNACVGRCNKRYTDVKDVMNCMDRTCEHQRKSCTSPTRA